MVRSLQCNDAARAFLGSQQSFTGISPERINRGSVRFPFVNAVCSAWLLPQVVPTIDPETLLSRYPPRAAINRMGLHLSGKPSAGGSTDGRSINGAFDFAAYTLGGALWCGCVRLEGCVQI
jgi:hypothetical protein